MDNLKPKWALPPDCGEPIDFDEFLRKAAQDPSMLDNVWQRAKRKCIASGSHDPQDDPYLLMLAAKGIKSWKAFDGIEGNEYTVHDIFDTEPVNLMIGLIGPTGSGKSMLLDRYVSLVVGEWFWMVHGCPNNCGPESLLKLLDETQIEKQPREFGDAKSLLKLREGAVDVCQSCKDQIFGTRMNPIATPCLDSVKLQSVQLQASSGHGLAFWTPSASEHNPGVPLEAALKQGTHLFVMRQPFAEKGKTSGSGRISQFHPLLEAVAGGRRLSDGTPCKAQVMFENNDGGFKNFRNNASDDPGTYLRRMRNVPRPYLSAVSRELRIYQRFLSAVNPCPNFDPFVLESIAVTAVFSRVNRKKTFASGTAVPNLSIYERMRIYDGDLTLLELRFGALAKKEGRPPIYSTATDHNFNLAQMFERLTNAAGGDYCFQGLSPQFMLDNIIQPLSEDGLNFPGARVTFPIAVDFFARKITEQRSIKDADADSDQKTMYDEVLAELALSKGASDEPKLIETWYRRRLRHAFELAFYPNRDELRDARFTLYFNVATALAVDDSHFINLNGQKSLITDQIKTRVLKPIELSTLGMGDQEVKDFRSRLKDRAALYLAAEAARMGVDVYDLEADHTTLPELKRAVAMLEGEEHFKKIGVCLDEKERSGKPLDADDVTRTERAMAALKALGYSEESLDQTLNYFRSFYLFRTWNGSGGHDIY
jgi:predicted Ser/Thr protein kinase